MDINRLDFGFSPVLKPRCLLLLTCSALLCQTNISLVNEILCSLCSFGYWDQRADERRFTMFLLLILQL